MTDYYPLLARAIAGLEKSTGEGRRALYERARNALVAQLRSVDPPLSESEITRERLALEEAVRKVEADAARQMRTAPPPPPRQPLPRAEEAPPPPRREPVPPPSRPPEDRWPDEDRAPPRPRPPEYPPVPGEGTPGFRDVVAEAQALGEATAQASRTAREAYAAVPADGPEPHRLEPRMEPEGLRGPPRPPVRRPPPPEPYPEPPPEAVLPEAVLPEEPPRRRPPGPAPRRPLDRDQEESGNPARRGLIAAIVAVIFIAGLGAGAYWQRERISALFGVVRTMGPTAPREPAQTRPKDGTRVGQEGQPTQPGQQTAPAGPIPAVAQRVVLYEEDPAVPEGNRYVGSALWRTETVSPGPGLSPELAIRADVEIPERRLAMTMSIRRNTDPALPASHTVEIMFNLPADFAFGGVANVPGLLMKEAEQMRGAPLSGLAVKVTNNFFLIGLSAVESDVQRNLQLLRERAWFDIPMVYNNNRRAILAIEKGNPGERAFAEGFAAWAKK